METARASFGSGFRSWLRRQQRIYEIDSSARVREGARVRRNSVNVGTSALAKLLRLAPNSFSRVHGILSHNPPRAGEAVLLSNRF